MNRIAVFAVIAFYLFSVLGAMPVKAQGALTILHQPVTEASVKEPIQLRAELSEPVSGKLMYIMYRRAGKKDFRSKAMNTTENNGFEGEIPAKEVEAGGIEYYLRLQDPIGNQLARYPEGDSHVSVTVVFPEPEPQISAPTEEMPPGIPVLPVATPMETAPQVPQTEEAAISEETIPAEEMSITHEAVTGCMENEPIVITAKLTGDAAGKLVYIMHRKLGKKDFQSQLMMPLGDSSFEGEIPGKSVDIAGLEYYLQIMDPIGNQLARYPADESFINVMISPMEKVEKVFPTEQPEQPVVEEKPLIIPEEPKKTGLQTWHWIGLGSLAVVGIAAIALSGGGDEPGNGKSALERLPDPPDRP